MHTCSGQMGQNVASPINLVGWVESLVSSWGENLNARAAAGWTEDQTFDANPEVRAAARLAPDYDSTDGTRALEIRFKRRKQGRQRERYLYVKFIPAGRRLDSPRVWRRLAKLPRRKRKHRKLGLAQLSRIIYWNQQVPVKDIRAQILIALIQLKLVSDARFSRDLAKYVQSIRKGVSRDIAWDVTGELLQHWSFPEDFRAFRKYVSTRLRLALRKILVLQAEESLIRAEDLHREIRNAESEFEPDDEKGNLEYSRKSNAPFLRIADWMTVDDAAFLLGISSSYIFKLIRRGALNKDLRGRRVKIRKEDIEDISKKLTAKKSRQEHQSKLIAAGIKYETARKRIYRKLGPLSHT
jgi:excisionase family DNA binding protein